MNRTPKNVMKWDKDKRLVKNYQKSYVGNYTDEESDMENFNFDKWLRSMMLKQLKVGRKYD